MSLKDYIKAAKGEIQVDLLLKNAKLIDVFTSEILETDLAIYNGKVVGLCSELTTEGRTTGEYSAKEVEDLNGQYLAPGFIDGHVHIESSMLSPQEFANAVLPLGTTTVIADPHEISNVMGIDGLKFMIESSKNTPLDIFFMVPSCVPTTSLETSGGKIDSIDIRNWIDNPRVLGLGEMMNFPGVIYGDRGVLEKIEVSRGKIIDGHAPLLSDKNLSAYIISGIKSDHECTSRGEALEKLRNGMFIMIREGSAARDLHALLPLVNQKNSRFFSFVTDDRHPDSLMDIGHINSMIKIAIASGLDPVLAIQMATINTALYFHLDTKGAVAPGYDADFVIFDNFKDFNIKRVYKSGVLVAENGNILKRSSINRSSIPPSLVNIKPIEIENLKVFAKSDRIRVIELVPNQIITKGSIFKAKVENGVIVSNTDDDIIKIAVIERHKATGNIGVGFIKGFGLKRGAIGSTVAHDSHNIIVIGVNDADILASIKAIEKMGGGQVVVNNGEIKASLPLPIAGLMSDRPIQEVRKICDNLDTEAHKLGAYPKNPFMTLSFLALPVIPELKITDRGLVDVNRFDFVPLFVD